MVRLTALSRTGNITTKCSFRTVTVCENKEALAAERNPARARGVLPLVVERRIRVGEGGGRGEKGGRVMKVSTVEVMGQPFDLWALELRIP